MARDWSRLEDEAAVADYVSMLEAELRGELLNKAAHRRTLKPLLNDRSDSAIERKHQNISAVLIELGYPYIDGYKPLPNYQQLLFDVVEDRLESDQALIALIEADVATPASLPSVEDILDVVVDAPIQASPTSDRVWERPRVSRRSIDYLAIEARNVGLGLAGEEFVLAFERARLIDGGKSALADQIEHTSVEQGDGAGYDIKSYEKDGTDRFIEVKTTAYGIYTPIHLTRNELFVSKDFDQKYHLYRPFHFRKAPRLFSVAGPLDQTWRLEATQYVGWIA